MDFLHPQKISDDHPAIELLHGLETTAYHVVKSSSGYPLVRCIIYAILRWANMLKRHLKVGALYGLVSLF